MLKTELIQPNTSPFSLPILVVRMKDGASQFCINYWALNTATIKDFFPITTVDGMIDEL